MDEDFGFDAGFDDAGSADLDFDSGFDESSLDTDISFDDIGSEDLIGGDFAETDLSFDAAEVFDDFEDIGSTELDMAPEGDDLLTETDIGSELTDEGFGSDEFTDLSADDSGLDLDNVDGDFETPETEDISALSDFETVDFDDALTTEDLTEDTLEEDFSFNEADDEGYFENIPNEVEPYVMEEAQAETDNLITNEEIASEIPDEVTAEVPDEVTAEFPDEVTAEVPDEVTGEIADDIPSYVPVGVSGDVSTDVTPETPETDKSPQQALQDYLYEHNYGQMDYPEYSQDPEWQALNEKYVQSLEDPQSDAVQPTDVPDISENLDVDNWIKDINPNFDPFDLDSAYDNNCGSCAFAVNKRLDGDTEIVASADNIGTVEEMNAATGMEQVPMTPEEIEKTLLEQGNGAHAIIGIDRADGPGHWFNAANIDGKVVTIDGQDGSISDWPPDYGDVTNWDMSVKKKG